MAWRRVCAAVIAAAVLSVCSVRVSVCSVRADENEDARTLLFSGRDLWRNGAFVYSGFVFAPSGLDQDGLLLKILFSGGLYRYEASNLGGERVIGTELLSQVLPGWRIKRGDAEFKFFFGPELQQHYLRPDDPSNRLPWHFNRSARRGRPMVRTDIKNDDRSRCLAVICRSQQFGAHGLRLARARGHVGRGLYRSSSSIFRL